MNLNQPTAPFVSPAASALNGVAALQHLGVLRVAGEDAARFIHGQLSNDFSLLGFDQARLAAYCTPQGRMLASFIGFRRRDSEILLLCDATLLPAMLKRLSMFVLRAKARLTDASAEFRVLGLAGSAVIGSTTPPWALQSLESGAAHCINLYPAQGVARQLWIASTDTPLPAGAELPSSLWQWAEVHSGVATLSPGASEAFVPQMLNYESVGGVNFKKGCYPGQEVVARSQFRGTLKRRAFLLHAEHPVAVGDPLFSAADDTQPAGTVVQVSPSPDGGCDLLASLQLSAVAAGGLRDGQNNALTLLPLPYPLLEDI